MIRDNVDVTQKIMVMTSHPLVIMGLARPLFQQVRSAHAKMTAQLVHTAVKKKK